jgi:flavin-dependent dehydrogenase
MSASPAGRFAEGRFAEGRFAERALASTALGAAGAALREQQRAAFPARHNSRVTHTSDVLVVGGGPAGCAAATLLARWGHTVTLVAKPAGPAPELGESVPPSTRKLFDILGVRAAIDAATFIRSAGNTVWWGSETPRVELFAAHEQGWQVTSDALAGILLEQARQSGVDVHSARAQTPNVSTVSATFVLDCTGRAGLLARARGLRVYDSRYRTVAMVGTWRTRHRFDLPDPSHTLIESYDGGWVWSVPRSPQERFVAVMVDPRTSAAAASEMSGLKPVPSMVATSAGARPSNPADLGFSRPVGPNSSCPQGPGFSSDIPADAHDASRSGLALYREQLGRTRHMARVIADATLAAGPTGWDASMYHATRYVDGNVLLVGDAASFLDPLSSAGIKKALASGWLAAVAVHTALVRPAMRDLALGFFAAREAEVYASFRSMTESFFNEAAAAHSHPFWRDRRDEPVPPSDRLGISAAFERLRQSPHFRVTRGPAAKVEQRPAVSGTEIVLEARLVADAQDAGVRHAFDVDLLGLIELAPAYSSVPDLFEAYNRRHAPVAPPEFLGALATVLARKWLLWL